MHGHGHVSKQTSHSSKHEAHVASAHAPHVAKERHKEALLSIDLRKINDSFGVLKDVAIATVSLPAYVALKTKSGYLNKVINAGLAWSLVVATAIGIGAYKQRNTSEAIFGETTVAHYDIADLSKPKEMSQVERYATAAALFGTNYVIPLVLNQPHNSPRTSVSVKTRDASNEVKCTYDHKGALAPQEILSSKPESIDVRLNGESVSGGKVKDTLCGICEAAMKRDLPIAR